MDYSGHTPDVEYPSKTRQLADDILKQYDELREVIVDKLLKDPGVVATFDNRYFVEFGDIQIETASEDLRNSNEYAINIVQKIKMVRDNRRWG